MPTQMELDKVREEGGEEGMEVFRQRVAVWVPSEDEEHFFTARDWRTMSSRLRTLLETD